MFTGINWCWSIKAVKREEVNVAEGDSYRRNVGDLARIIAKKEKLPLPLKMPRLRTGRWMTVEQSIESGQCAPVK